MRCIPSLTFLSLLVASAARAELAKDEIIDHLMNKCSKTLSFVDHGPANRLEAIVDLPMPAKSLKEAQILYKNFTRPKNELFCAKWWMHHEKFYYDEKENIITMKGDSYTAVLRNFLLDPTNYCTSIGMDVRKESWEKGLMLKINFASFLHAVQEDGETVYRCALPSFNCHLNKRYTAREEELCGTFFGQAGDLAIIGCALGHAEGDRNTCRQMQKAAQPKSK